MTRKVGTRGSPRIHLDGEEEEGFPPAVDHYAANAADRGKKNGGNHDSSKEPAALDANRLRRLSFGGGGGGGGGGGKSGSGTNNSVSQALDRTKEGRRASGAALSAVPVPVERPKFHHGEHKKRLPKVCSNHSM